MKTGQRVRANLDTWNKGDFERNGQLDALGKDFGGSGTVVTPAKRNRVSAGIVVPGEANTMY